EPIVKSEHVEQAFSYAIHPDVRTRSYALCNGRELVLYDIDRSEPAFRVQMSNVGTQWNEVLKHFSPEALRNHHHRHCQPDLGIFLRNAGFTGAHEITFINSRVLVLGRTLNGIITAAAAYEMTDGVGCMGSFDMPTNMLPVLLSCLPDQVARMAANAL